MLRRSRPTLTRPDRDRLGEMLGCRCVEVRWALFAGDLLREITRARVVEADRIPGDVVTMHSTVRLLDLALGRTEICTLVYPAESDPAAGAVSVLAPLGTALLGGRVGDTMRVAGASGRRALRIEEILFQPESAGVERP